MYEDGRQDGAGVDEGVMEGVTEEVGVRLHTGGGDDKLPTDTTNTPGIVEQ